MTPIPMGDWSPGAHADYTAATPQEADANGSLHPDTARALDAALRAEAANRASPAPESDGELLARLGTDATRWAQAFADGPLFRERTGAGICDQSTLVGWFANAIEAGRTAGYAAAVEWQETVEAMEPEETEAAPMPAGPRGPVWLTVEVGMRRVSFTVD